jgi:hypothetical protein
MRGRSGARAGEPLCPGWSDCYRIDAPHRTDALCQFWPHVLQQTSTYSIASSARASSVGFSAARRRGAPTRLAPRPSRVMNSHDAVGDQIGIVLAPFTGCTARRRTLKDQRGYGRSHRRASGRSSACLPESVIRTRVTAIARSSATTRSVVTLASPVLISSTNRSLLKPCASRMPRCSRRAMRRAIRARAGARRCGAGPLPFPPCIECKLCLRDRRVAPGMGLVTPP